MGKNELVIEGVGRVRKRKKDKVFLLLKDGADINNLIGIVRDEELAKAYASSMCGQYDGGIHTISNLDISKMELQLRDELDRR